MPCGRAVKTASASGIAWSMTRPDPLRWGCDAAIGWLSRLRPYSPVSLTLGWFSNSRTSSPPAYPVAPTMPTVRILAPGRLRNALGPRFPEVVSRVSGVGRVAVMVGRVYGRMNSYATGPPPRSYRRAARPLPVARYNHEDPGHHEPVQQPAIQERFRPPRQDAEEHSAQHRRQLLDLGLPDVHQREWDHLEPYGVGPVLASEAPKQPAAEEELPREEVDRRVDDESPGRSACDRLGVVGAEVRLPTDGPDHNRHDGDADDGDWQAAAPVAQGEPVAARVLAPG